MKIVPAMHRIAQKIYARKRLRIALMTLVVLIPALLWLYHWSSAPASSTITVGTPQPAAATSALSWQPLTTAYFTTEVPGGWQLEAPSTVNGRLQTAAHAVAGNHGQLGITTAAMPPDGLRGIGDYNLRYSDPASYPRQTAHWLPADTQLFTTADTATYTAFMTHDGHYTEVTVSSLATPAQSLAILQHILIAWQWSAP